MLACKLAATGFNGVELNEVNLSLNEAAETPLDNFALPSGIFVLYSLCGRTAVPGSWIFSPYGSQSMVSGNTSCTG